MKLIENKTAIFDNKVFRVEITGREMLNIYAGLMNISPVDLNVFIEREFGYKDSKVHYIDELGLGFLEKLIRDNL